MIRQYSIIILTVLFLISCNDKEKPIYILKKPKTVTYDSIGEWIKNDKNFFENNYESVFNKAYNEKIEIKDYQGAADILELVAKNAMRLQSFNASFQAKIIFFSENYRNKIKNQQSLTFLNKYLGKYYSDKSEFEKAITYFESGLKFEVVDYQTCLEKANNYTSIAWCNYCLGKQETAIIYNLKALDLLQQTDQKDILGGVYGNLYPVYLSTKDYKNAEISLNKSIYYYKFNPEKQAPNIFICLFNKIQLYDEMGENTKKNLLIDSTLIAYKASKLDYPSIKISLSLIDFNKKLDFNKIAEAEQLLIDIKQEVDLLNSGLVTNDYNTALAMLEIKKDKGLQQTSIIKAAIPSLSEIRDFQNVKKAYSILYDDAYEKKEFEKALTYLTNYHIASDSLGNQKVRNKVNELEKKYQTEKKEQQIVIHKRTIVNKNTTIALLASLFIGIFLIVIVFITKQKQKKLLNEKLNAQLYTKQLLEKTEEERKRIASDLHDSVSHELLSLKNLFSEKTSETNGKIDAIINDIRIISRNLHPIMFDKIGLKESIIQLIERTQSVHHFMVTEEIDYHTDLLSSTELQIYRIVQEALSNIIKYAGALAAKITIWETEKIIHLEIKDNGKGFNVNETLNNKNAFGLHNIIERSRAIGGTTNIFSDKNGTIIKIEIKIS